MELVSQHNHTNFTGHGKGEIEQLIATASQKGLTNIAVTEHYPLSAQVDPTNFVSMPWSRLDEYCERILSQRRNYPNMEIVLGCELDWLGDEEDRDFSDDAFDRFDIILGSVHFLHLWPLDDSSQAAYWDEVGHDAIWDMYFEQWCKAATSSFPFTVMSHPDLVKKFNKYPSGDPRRYYKDAAEAAYEGQRMIEVNTSGAYYDCREMYPNIDLLKEFYKAGIPCTIGSDAHVVENVDRSLRGGLKLMYEAGYRNVTVVMPEGERREIPIE